MAGMSSCWSRKNELVVDGKVLAGKWSWDDEEEIALEMIVVADMKEGWKRKVEVFVKMEVLRVTLLLREFASNSRGISPLVGETVVLCPPFTERQRVSRTACSLFHVVMWIPSLASAERLISLHLNSFHPFQHGCTEVYERGHNLCGSSAVGHGEAWVKLVDGWNWVSNTHQRRDELVCQGILTVEYAFGLCCVSPD